MPIWEVVVWLIGQWRRGSNICFGIYYDLELSRALSQRHTVPATHKTEANIS